MKIAPLYILDAMGHKWQVNETETTGERALWVQSADRCPSVCPRIVGFYAASMDAVKARLNMPAGELVALLNEISELNERFHAVKQIRAFAAEENQETKKAIREKIARALEIVK
jgi:hypothetical protein